MRAAGDWDGNLIWAVVVVVIGLLQWVAEKLQKKPTAGPPPVPLGSARAPGSPEAAAAAAQAERMRKFQEALGLPAGAGELPGRRPAQGSPEKRRATPPVPPIVARDPGTLRPSASREATSMRQPTPREAAPPPLLPPVLAAPPVLAPPFVPAPVDPRPALPTPARRETVAGRVSPSGRVTPAAPLLADAETSAAAAVRLLLASGGARSAMLLAEVLGPPRSLQSATPRGTL